MLSLTMRMRLDENENAWVCSHYLSYARDFLCCFVAKCQELYGNTFILDVLHFDRNFSDKSGIHLGTDLAVYHFQLEVGGNISLSKDS